MSDEPRRRLSPSARRANLTETALEIFAAKGYQDTSMAEIADAAGINRSVLYDRFPSKRVLFMTVLQEQFAASIALSAPGAGGSPERRIQAAVDAYLRYARQNPAGRRLLFDLADEDDPEIQVTRRGIREARNRMVARLLAGELARGGLTPASPEAGVLVEMLLTGMDGLAQWWEHNPEVPHEDIVEIAMMVLWRGLGRRRPSGRRDDGPAATPPAATNADPSAL